METLLALTVSGSALTILLLVLRYGVMKKMPSTVYYYAWLFVLLRFLLPLPGLIPSVFGGADSVPETAAYTAAAETGTADRQPALYETAPVSGTQGISENRTEESAPLAGAAAPAADVDRDRQAGGERLHQNGLRALRQRRRSVPSRQREIPVLRRTGRIPEGAGLRRQHL